MRPFATRTLAGPASERLSALALPRREAYTPSPADWRDEVLYFLLPDRFSDGAEATRPLLDRADLTAARPALAGGVPWRWDAWAASGAERWQGGTIDGVRSKLAYLADLGVTAIWLGPVFKQRAHLDTYHGYGIQDFLEVDPRFGTRRDLVDLITAAHRRGISVILDVIFNHTGCNWLYPTGTPAKDASGDGRFEARFAGPGRHGFGAWRGADGAALAGAPATRDDAVWPRELQDSERYTRAGTGDLGAGAIDDPRAEHKRSDFVDLRDIALDRAGALDALARCYKHWIALCDCDGLRIDTLKHVSFEEARNFCGTIKEYAANLGKADFLLIGEVAGGDANQDRYLQVLGRNLDAALDIGEMRLHLNQVAKGLAPANAYFAGFDPGRAVMGSHRNIGLRHVSVLDDHDHVFGAKVRFASGAATPTQATVAMALQLFSLGIPCLYYGTEQALAAPEADVWRFLPEIGRSDRYLREAMFGPRHPRRAGGLAIDTTLPGFGPFGTAGRHVFDPTHPLYLRIAAMTALRRRLPVLRYGRQYLRPLSLFDAPFAPSPAGELLAWSRVLDDEEALIAVNANGTAARGGAVVVDSALNPPGSALTIVLETALLGAPTVTHRLAVERRDDGTAFVRVPPLPPSEAMVLINQP